MMLQLYELKQLTDLKVRHYQALAEKQRLLNSRQRRWQLKATPKEGRHGARRLSYGG
jgi:hypothetical protein